MILATVLYVVALPLIGAGVVDLILGFTKGTGVTNDKIKRSMVLLGIATVLNIMAACSKYLFG
ncbi:MAG: hypothetical protein V1896_02405 [Candidatus Zambryskibacteria bacterium]